MKVLFGNTEGKEPVSHSPRIATQVLSKLLPGDKSSAVRPPSFAHGQLRAVARTGLTASPIGSHLKEDPLASCVTPLN